VACLSTAAARCRRLDTTYAEINSTATDIGVTVNMSCLPGYRVVGQSTATVRCTNTGQWSLTNAACLRTSHCSLVYYIYWDNTATPRQALCHPIDVLLSPPITRFCHPLDTPLAATHRHAQATQTRPSPLPRHAPVKPLLAFTQSGTRLFW